MKKHRTDWRNDSETLQGGGPHDANDKPLSFSSPYTSSSDGIKFKTHFIIRFHTFLILYILYFCCVDPYMTLQRPSFENHWILGVLVFRGVPGMRRMEHRKQLSIIFGQQSDTALPSRNPWDITLKVIISIITVACFKLEPIISYTNRIYLFCVNMILQ